MEEGVEAKVYSAGIATVEIYGITFTMREREIRELIRILTCVLFDIARSRDDRDRKEGDRS